MNIIEKALKKAKELEHDETLRVLSVGSDKNFEVVMMTSDEIEKTGDGFEMPIFAVNKNTGEETINYMAGFSMEQGFVDLDFNTLNYKDY